MADDVVAGTVLFANPAVLLPATEGLSIFVVLVVAGFIGGPFTLRKSSNISAANRRNAPANRVTHLPAHGARCTRKRVHRPFGPVLASGARPPRSPAADTRDPLMVTAFVLMNVERDMVNEVAEALADMDGITEVYSVSGRYDLIAIIRVRDNEALADLVTGHMLKLQGIQNTETVIAFRAYSRHDLETMFAIGMGA